MPDNTVGTGTLDLLLPVAAATAEEAKFVTLAKLNKLPPPNPGTNLRQIIDLKDDRFVLLAKLE